VFVKEIDRLVLMGFRAFSFQSFEAQVTGNMMQKLLKQAVSNDCDFKSTNSYFVCR
jgi:hypothetical protein